VKHRVFLFSTESFLQQRGLPQRRGAGCSPQAEGRNNGSVATLWSMWNYRVSMSAVHSHVGGNRLSQPTSSCGASPSTTCSRCTVVATGQKSEAVFNPAGSLLCLQQAEKVVPVVTAMLSAPEVRTSTDRTRLPCRVDSNWRSIAQGLDGTLSTGHPRLSQADRLRRPGGVLSLSRSDRSTSLIVRSVVCRAMRRTFVTVCGAPVNIDRKPGASMRSLRACKAPDTLRRLPRYDSGDL